MTAVTLARGGGVEKKIPGTGVQLFLGGEIPPEEEGGEYKKNLHKIFSTPKPEISSTLPHLFGFGRCKEDIFQDNH